MLPLIRDKLETLPAAPGVYLMKDQDGEVFYVGKAKRLRDRVRSYFGGTDQRFFVGLLSTLFIEVILTDSEKEALILEDDLIKRYQPRFNVKLVDDKRFLCLRLDTRNRYPRLQVVRQFAKDGARYFGPYSSAQAIRQTLRLVNRHFMLRTCSDRVMQQRRKPCLQFQIQRCPAPCVHDLSGGEYDENVSAVVAFLEGRQNDLLATLTERMGRLAAQLEYERAAKVRDQIRAVERSLERQRLVSPDFINRDVIGLYRDGPAVEVHVMRTRDGRLVDAGRYSFSDVEVPAAELLADFAARYYDVAAEIPDEILFPPEMEWSGALGLLLAEQSGRKPRLLVPQRGDKRRLVELATRNAGQAFKDKQRQEGAARTAVERLQRALHLRHPPESLECFDISHLQGETVVASAVRFDGGVAQKRLYRSYKIRSTSGQDDFQSMYEVIGRRARRGLEEGDLPRLLVIDGGKGQLNAARAALDDHGIDEVELIGLAKARPARGAATAESTASAVPERVFVLGQKTPVLLRPNSAELFLLTRARDEAHRFAISFQKRTRRKKVSRSALEDIPGVGPKRRRALLTAFGSMAGVRAAAPEALARVVGAKLATTIQRALAKD